MIGKIRGPGTIVGDMLTRRDAVALQRWWNTHPLHEKAWPPKEVWIHQIVVSLVNPKFYAVERLFKLYDC